MHQQSLMMMFILTVILPVTILFTNHDIFFIVTALVLLILSLGNIFSNAFGSNDENDQEEDPMIEELEELLDIDIKKLNTGIKFSRNLIGVLFFFYCSFFIQSIFFGILAALLMLYWIHKAIETMSPKKLKYLVIKSKPVKKTVTIISAYATIALIIYTAIHKFSL